MLPDDYLTEVGRIAMEWSHLEQNVEEAIWKLLHFNPTLDTAAAVTMHVPFRVRLDIISSYARAVPLEKTLGSGLITATR